MGLLSHYGSDARILQEVSGQRVGMTAVFRTSKERKLEAGLYEVGCREESIK